MFYEPDKRNHGLRHDPFKNLVVPRPIGWISTLDENGVANLAPYSFFNAVASDPPIVIFGAGMRPRVPEVKDSQRNIEITSEFVVNLATYALREQMNQSSAPLPAGVSEFAAAGLETAPSTLVRPPRVKASPVHLECKYLKTVEVPCNDPTRGNYVIFGRVVGIHIDDSLIADGLVDIARARPIARLGYMDYTAVDMVFSLIRPE
jgi:flavin reductase (DIM6/NTAB) family NADH-FMN oxidoreductase RutF